MTERDLILRWINWKERTGGRPFPQKDLAAAAGMSPTYLSSILTGARNAGTKTIERIAAAIGVSISAFYSGPPDEPPKAGETGRPAPSAAPLPPPASRPSPAPAPAPLPRMERIVPSAEPSHPQTDVPQKDMGLRFAAAGPGHIDRLLGSYGFPIKETPPRVPPSLRSDRRAHAKDVSPPSPPSEPSFGPEHDAPAFRQSGLTGMECASSIPLLAKVPAGTWRDWIEGKIDPPAERIPIVPVEPGRAFAVRAADESMAPKIEKGTLLVVNPETRFSAFDGGIGMVARGGTFTVRHVYAVGDSYILVPSNPEFYPEVVPAADAQVFRIAFHIPE